MKAVLVGDALTPASDPIVAKAAEIARRTGAELHLAHGFLMPPAYFMAPSAMEVVYSQLLEVEEVRRRQQLDAQLERLGLADAAATSLVAAGIPHRQLIARAREIEADLIVLGASEDEGTRALGSVAERVLRKASCPVLLLRGDLPLPPGRVLAPVDLSPLSDQCLRRGLELIAELDGDGPAVAAPDAPDRGRSITALFVLTPQERETSSQFTPEQIDRFAHDELERLCARLGSGNARRFDTRVRVGGPRREILRELDESAADLVVIATHGRSGFERLLLGSVAAAVAQHAPTSVLVVPPGEPPEEGEESTEAAPAG